MQEAGVLTIGEADNMRLGANLFLNKVPKGQDPAIWILQRVKNAGMCHPDDARHLIQTFKDYDRE